MTCTLNEFFRNKPGHVSKTSGDGLAKRVGTLAHNAKLHKVFQMADLGKWIARSGVLALLFLAFFAMLLWDPRSHFKPIRQDHIVHFVVFYSLMLGIVLSFPSLKVWSVALILITLGVSLEFVQPHLGRECSLSDMVADLIGVSFAAMPLWIGKTLTVQNGNN